MKLSKVNKKSKKLIINEVTAQFASSADIDNYINKPSLDFIGTGEGIGVEGYGLYFSTTQETHDYYARNVGSKSYIVDLNVNDKELIFYDFTLADIFKNVIHTVPHWYKQCITKVLWPNREKIKDFYTHLHELRGRKKVLTFVREIIGFGKKIIVFQTPSGSEFTSQKEFAKVVAQNTNGFVFYMLLEYLLNGNNIESMISKSRDTQWGKSASTFLLKVGCKGIKYLDHGSRENDEYYHDKNSSCDIELLFDKDIRMTYNYVIFDKDVIKIKWKKDNYNDKGQNYHGMLDWNKNKSGKRNVSSKEIINNPEKIQQFLKNLYVSKVSTNEKYDRLDSIINQLSYKIDFRFKYLDKNNISQCIKFYNIYFNIMIEALKFIENNFNAALNVPNNYVFMIDIINVLRDRILYPIFDNLINDSVYNKKATLNFIHKFYQAIEHSRSFYITNAFNAIYSELIDEYSDAGFLSKEEINYIKS